MAIFSTFFLGNISEKNVFYDILEGKNAFLGSKNKMFKMSTNWHFSKRLTHGFAPKMAIFPTFFLGNISEVHVFNHILERKNAPLSYKNKKFKKSKNWHFSKELNPWFLVQKRTFFQFFFFRQYSRGKCLLRYSRTKKRLSRL